MNLADALEAKGYRVHYERLDRPRRGSGGRTYEEKLAAFARGARAEELVCWEVEDKFFEARLVAMARAEGLGLRFLESPGFLTPRPAADAWLRDHRPRMAEFYRWQRRRLEVLVDGDGSPTGGRWSLDAENRKALPADVPVPDLGFARPNLHVRDLIPLVQERFADHPGALAEADWWLPVTRAQALAWLQRFLDERFAAFGPYEDALSTRGPFLFHSVLSPALNLGLLTPREVLDRALAAATAGGAVPLNSLEGFVRQLIGWREFVRAIYRRHSARQEKANFFGHRRRLGPAWYEATTGIPPLDDTILKAQRWGWAHHIERLMVLGNLMLLSEIEPREAWRWFMEMFVDSADWVMGPNVYGMGIFSDGGLFATKPYICGSNYLLKMSDYRKPRPAPGGEPSWCETVDGLYWRFIAERRDYFGGNPRLARMLGTLDRMAAERRERIFGAAEAFLRRVTV